MGTGILNVVIGLVLLGLGSTGKFKILGGSPKILMAVGAALAVLGAVQIVRGLMRRKPPTQDD